ncbi:MAG: TolC family protein [Dokdonella sp.]|uniref:TolC family protein n=1 Tax=Dokdonella sp. TaxID=2291710 RepID=UPI003F8144A1
MWLRLAATAALVFARCDIASAQAPSVITLEDAFARVAERHPDLRWVDLRGDVLAADLAAASQGPPLSVGATLENAFGTGDTRGVRAAELSLTLASVFERGGKLDARRTLAQSRIDALAVERATRRLDLLADVARRHLDIVAERARRRIADIDVAQRERAVAAAEVRLRAGASPESVVLAARAALARAQVDRDRGLQRFDAARRHLAVLWGERDPQFDVAAADPTVLPPIGDAAALAALLEQAPEMSRFADERRIREARLELARSEASADVQWQLGVRRLGAGDDTALIASVSVPLGARSRAQPAQRAAQAELAAIEVEREGKDLALQSTLLDAHGRYRAARLEVERVRDDVLPLLAKAEAAAERAYRGGAASYLEWAQLQSARTAELRQQLDVAVDAQRALIEIQRLTGQSMSPAATTTHTTEAPR